MFAPGRNGQEAGETWRWSRLPHALSPQATTVPLVVNASEWEPPPATATTLLKPRGELVCPDELPPPRDDRAVTLQSQTMKMASGDRGHIGQSIRG